MFGSNYKEYPLIVYGDHPEDLIYAVKVYSGKNPLLFMIDTGASCSVIGNTALKGCEYEKLNFKNNVFGIGGKVSVSKIYLSFDFNEKQAAKGEHRFSLTFDSIQKKDNEFLNSGDVNGLLGLNFLQFCTLDLREGVLRVYNKPGSIYNQRIDSLFAKMDEE